MAKTGTGRGARSTPQKRHAKRKEPQQKRSQNTVAAIKQAAVLLMQEKGIRDVGTHEIAERAGVSIGSLYQYFPNREAILAAVYEDISIEFAATLRASIPALAHLPTEPMTRRTVTMLLAMYERHQLVLLQLTHEMPDLHLSEQAYSFRILAHGSTRAYLANRPDVRRERDLERKAFFLEQIIIGSITSYLRDKPPMISRAEFLRDLTRIVTAYLDNWQPADTPSASAVPPAVPASRRRKKTLP